jgi:predicted NAD/FAD-dependent oxidoreductase
MRVVVVGAGMAGLVAARTLRDAGASVSVVDKGRSPGGRMATRRIGPATMDHGAQFFTVRTPAFARRVDDWLERGLVRIWSNGFDTDDGHPRYVGTAGMNALAKDLAIGLDVRCSSMAFAVRRGSRSPWTVVIDDGTAHDADAVVVTTPLPQAYALLADAGIELDDQLMRTEYDRTIALLAQLGDVPAVPAPGAAQSPSPDVAFVADNVAKGISAAPAITLHASAAWSETNWDEPIEVLADRLVELARPWLGDVPIVEHHVKKWRFATPRSPWPDPCWHASGIVLAGDAFAGPRVEAAHNSGLAAAHTLAG